MFLPNTYSFVLTRGIIVDPSFTPEARRGVFLPNTYSFVLTRGIIVDPSFTPEARRGVFLPSTYSFVLRRRPIVDSVRGKTSLEEGSSGDHAFLAGPTSSWGR